MVKPVIPVTPSPTISPSGPKAIKLSEKSQTDKSQPELPKAVIISANQTVTPQIPKPILGGDMIEIKVDNRLLAKLGLTNTNNEPLLLKLTKLTSTFDPLDRLQVTNWANKTVTKLNQLDDKLLHFIANPLVIEIKSYISLIYDTIKDQAKKPKGIFDVFFKSKNNMSDMLAISQKVKEVTQLLTIKIAPLENLIKEINDNYELGSFIFDELNILIETGDWLLSTAKDELLPKLIQQSQHQNLIQAQKAKDGIASMDAFNQRLTLLRTIHHTSQLTVQQLKVTAEMLYLLTNSIQKLEQVVLPQWQKQLAITYGIDTTVKAVTEINKSLLKTEETAVLTQLEAIMAIK